MNYLTNLVRPAASVVALTCSVCVAQIQYDANNRPVSIDAVEVGGVDYRVSFDHGVTFAEAYGGYPTPTASLQFWGDDAGAHAAVEAIAGALNAAGVYPAVTTSLVVPTETGSWFFGDYVELVSVDFAEGDAMYSFQPPDEGSRGGPNNDAGTWGWAHFAPVASVPEPSTLVLARLCAVGFAALVRGRSRSAR